MNSESYSCRHFTRAWTRRFPPATKEIAGEEMLYKTLLELARLKKYPEPILLAEYEDPKLLARTEGYPDVYQKVNNVEFLFEAKNHFYYHADWGHPAPFYQQSPKWVRENVERKRWKADKIPIRGSRKQVWDSSKGRPEWQWTEFVYLMNRQNIRECYASTVKSFTPDALPRMEKFFGLNQVYTDHAILSPEMCETSEDVDCAVETSDNLIILLAELIARELKR